MRPMLTLACASLLDYSGIAPPQARRGGRVHPHRDPAPRRCRRRLGHAPRQAHRQPHLGQSGERAGRRFPVQPRVRTDGRGRQPASVLKILSHASAVIAEGEVDQLTAQRRIDTGEEHYLAHHRRQDRGSVRRRLPHRGGGRGGRRGRRAGARMLRPQPRHRLPAGRRRDRLCLGFGDDGQGRSATISATAR